MELICPDFPSVRVFTPVSKKSAYPYRILLRISADKKPKWTFYFRLNNYKHRIKFMNYNKHTHTHAHTHIYIYIYGRNMCKVG